MIIGVVCNIRACLDPGNGNGTFFVQNREQRPFSWNAKVPSEFRPPLVMACICIDAINHHWVNKHLDKVTGL